MDLKMLLNVSCVSSSFSPLSDLKLCNDLFIVTWVPIIYIIGLNVTLH